MSVCNHGEPRGCIQCKNESALSLHERRKENPELSKRLAAVNQRLKAYHAAKKQVNTRRIQRVLIMFAQGRTIEEIAKWHNVTRERIRQMINKGIRVAVMKAKREAIKNARPKCECCQ